MVRWCNQEVMNMRISRSVKFTLWANRLIALVMTGLIFAMPALLKWYSAVRPLGAAAAYAICIAFYLCCVPVFGALWNLDRLLRNILRQEVFVRDNVRCIRMVRWFCLAVCLICLPAAFLYAPLIFMTLIMAFLCLIVNVIAQVMKAAVEIREENDLTV